MREELAFFGGGCFWCLDAVFRQIQGVMEVHCGYMGGHHPAPDYHAVCKGNSGHAEVVRVRFDSDVVTYAVLLDVFFSIHDPTQLNRQGHDIGTQYRSIILWHTLDQKDTAQQILQKLSCSGKYMAPIVTELLQADLFHEAELEHQDYFCQHSEQGYCAVVIAPKLMKFRKKYLTLLKNE